MKTISRYIMTLALLLTAVTGAWAQSTVQCSLDDITIEPGGSATTNFNLTNPDDKFCACQFTIQFPQGISIAYDTDEEEYVASMIKNRNKHHSIDVVYNSVYTVTVASHQDFQGTEGPLINFSIVADNNAVAGNYDCYITNVTLTKTEGDPVTFESIPFKVTISGSEPAATEPAIDVTTDAAEEGATFTEATFAMPAFDATAEYELVRDMSIQMTATMGDGTDGVRYRVKKAQQGEGYEPADLNMMQVLALVAVNDGIEHKDLTLEEDYFCRIYKLDEQTLQPEGDGVELYDFDFAPGLYALKAFATDGSDYDGETALSNTFKLFQGYEVEVAAKEFITYYKDEPLYADTETSADAELYTISTVNGDQAVLSAAIETAPSLTPLLIFNNSDEAKTFLLIPANEEPNLQLTVAPEFQGTLTGTTIAASTENVTNYAFNGKAFVFVKNAIEVGPNKAWLSISNSNARTISLVFSDETTGISLTPNPSPEGEGSVYDLRGRKLQGMPTKKGVYIMNGRKVVVK